MNSVGSRPPTPHTHLPPCPHPHPLIDIFVQSKGADLTRFQSFYCLFSCFSDGRLCSRILLGLTVKRCHENFHLHHCPPATIITCRSGCMLIAGHGYLQLNRLPMKIGVASGNKDKERYPSAAILPTTCICQQGCSQRLISVKCDIANNGYVTCCVTED